MKSKLFNWLSNHSPRWLKNYHLNNPQLADPGEQLRNVTALEQLRNVTALLGNNEVQDHAIRTSSHYADSALRGLVKLIANATENDQRRRLIAMSWFSQLIVDLTSWNREFIDFLLSYPGFRADYSLTELETFQKEVTDRVRDLCGYPIRGRVVAPICQRLQHLERRLSKDFQFLAEEQPATYEAIRTLVGEHIRSPNQFISLAIALGWDIKQVNRPLGNTYPKSGDPPPPTDHVKARIDEYIRRSAETLENLDAVLNEAGLELLTVEEFHELCNPLAEDNHDKELPIADRTVLADRPKFDIAISYASEDISYARALAVAAKSHGLRVFFDHFDAANLWGAHLGDYLGSVFGRDALFTVVLVSKKYASKAWTTFELQEARTKAIITKHQSILPILLEDCDVPGLTTGISHQHWTLDSPGDLLQLLVEKVKSLC